MGVVKVPEEFGLLSWPDGDELFDSQKEPGSRSTSAHKPGSPRKSSQATFRPLSKEELAARTGAPQPNPGVAGAPRSWAQQLIDENREELIEITQILFIKVYRLAKPHVKRAYEEHMVPFTKRRVAAGRTKLEQLRQERRARRAPTTPEATQPCARTQLQPVLTQPQNMFDVGTPQMTTDELQRCRAAADELRMKASLLDQIADAAQVIPEQETLELNASSAMISHRQMPSIDVLALEATQSNESDIVGQIHHASIRKVLGGGKDLSSPNEAG